MESIKKLLLVAIIAVFSTSFAAPQPGTLFGIDIVPQQKEPESRLYTINPATGSTNLIGNTGFRDCSALDTDPLTNELLAVCFDMNILDSILIKIDPATGQGSFVGPLNINMVGINRIRDISFRSDGVLFAYGAAKPNGLLGVIDTDSGNFTLVGDTGVSSGTGGLGFSLADVLFFAGFGPMDMQDLFILDQGDASSTFVAQLNFFQNPDDPSMRSLDANPLDDVLFGIYVHDLGTVTLATVDADTGDVLAIGPTDDIFMTAIAFLNPLQPRPIPTLSQYGLILAAIALLAAATIFLMRRRSISGA